MEKHRASRTSFFPGEIRVASSIVGARSLLSPRCDLPTPARYPPSFSPFSGYRSLPLIAQLALFLCLTLSSWAASVQAEQGEIRYETIPSLGEVRPLSDPVRIALTVLDAERKTVHQGQLRVRLTAPPPGRFFSTDFPLVEGSRLLGMDLPVVQGEVAWEYVFPIRGIYRLEVRADGVDGKEIARVFELGVKENRMKLFYLGSFMAGLFFLGFIAGRLFTTGG